MPTSNTNVKPIVEHALEMARRGLRVFPLIENTKFPAIGQFYDEATTDEAKIRAWFHGSNCRRNYGISTDDLAVLDVDTKSGKYGLDNLEGLEIARVTKDLSKPKGAPTITLAVPTLVVQTPTGGLHLYYRAEIDGRTDHANRKEVLGPCSGLDVRGFHGYVVGPGSEIDGVAYRIAIDKPIGTAPAVLEPFLRAPGTRVRGEGSEAADDSEEAIARGVHYLGHNAPLAIQGQGGNDTAYQVCAKLTRDFGLSEPMASELLEKHWNDRCAPPWNPDELHDIVCHSISYGQNARASSVPNDEDFEGIEDLIQEGEKTEKTEKTEGKNKTKRKMDALGYDEIADLATTEGSCPLVYDLLDQGAMSVFYGESNAGKTFVALDLAEAVASGQPWNGLKTERGLVVYVVAEGGRTFSRRVAALRKRYIQKFGADAPKPLLAIVRYPIDLRTNDADVKGLVTLVKEQERKYGVPCMWVIVDTLFRAMAGGDDNSPVDMGKIVDSADKIRGDTEAHFTYVHHTGKDVARGARGHSSLRAATDTEIEITPGKFRATKQRDLEHKLEFKFGLEGVSLGLDQFGRDVRSAVVIWDSEEVTNAAKPVENHKAENNQDQRILVAIRDNRVDKKSGWTCSHKDIAAKTGIKNGSVSGIIGRLKKKKLIRYESGVYWLTIAGEKVANTVGYVATWDPATGIIIPDEVGTEPEWAQEVGSTSN